MIPRFPKPQQEDSDPRRSDALRTAIARLDDEIPPSRIPGYRAAKREAAAALRRRPRSPSALLDCARFLFADGRASIARRCAEKAAALEPRSSFVLHQAASVLWKGGERDRGYALLERAVSLSGRAEPLLQRAWFLWEEHAFPAPAPPAPGERPPSPSRALERLLRAAGRLPEAARSLEEAIGKDPRAPRLARDAMRFFLLAGEIDRAESCLDLSLRGEEAPPLSGLARIALWKGRWRRAEFLARRALRAAGEAPALDLTTLGASAGRLGRTRRARSALEAADALDPCGEASLWLCEFDWRSGDAASARRRLESCLAAGFRSQAVEILRVLLGERPGRLFGPPLDPRDRSSPFARALARCLERMGGNRTHLHLVADGGSALCSTRPESEEGFDPDRERDLALSIACEQILSSAALRPLDEAFDELRALAEALPREPQPRAYLAELLLWKGRYGEAEELFRRVSRVAGARIWWLVARGGIDMLRGEPGRGLARLDEALARGAPMRSVGPWRGECLRVLGEPEEALAALCRVPATFPFHPSLWLNLALALGEAGRAAKQAALLDALQRHAPGLFDAAAEGASERSGRPLKAALAGMLGNRSELCATRRTERGVGSIPIRGC